MVINSRAFPPKNSGKWANIMNYEDNAKRAAETPRAKASREKKEKKSRNNRNRNNNVNTRNVRMMRSSFKRLYGRNPDSYLKSRRRRQGRPSRSPSPVSRKASPTRRRSPPKHVAKTHKAHAPVHAGPKPRAGKVMRQCMRDCESTGCQRHADTKDCKFVHKNEPEFAMLREDQKGKQGGAVAPLSKVNTYTSWPGGIDPTVRLYNQASML